jgi:ABC-2 type transport system permease protein
MYALRLMASFVRASLQEELAYRSNFAISLLHSLLNLLTGFLGLQVVFSQVYSLGGWSWSQALALLGVYLMAGALRGLFIGPSLDMLVGMGQEVASGNFDFTLLRPVDTQFLITFRRWQLLALVDLGLGVSVLVAAFAQGGAAPGAGQLAGQVLAFLLAFLAGMAALYAILLALTALVFWSPGMFFTWVFDALFQLARYPVGIYPAWMRFFLTWIIPLGIMTTISTQALTGQVTTQALLGSVAASAVLLAAASLLFRRAVRRYASASS